jgi:hypothetical protein
LLIKKGFIIDNQAIVNGERWRYDGTSRHFISSDSRYGPMWMYVTVVYDDGENVHYRADHSPNKVSQTPRERFFEVASRAPVEEYGKGQKEYSFAESYLIDFKLDQRSSS